MSFTERNPHYSSPELVSDIYCRILAEGRYSYGLTDVVEENPEILYNVVVVFAKKGSVDQLMIENRSASCITHVRLD